MLAAPRYRIALMPASPTRYRVTITPLQPNGLHCNGRCSIEFEQSDRQDWMRQVERTQGLPGLTGDERTALAIGACLLDSLIQRHPDGGHSTLDRLRAPLAELLRHLRD